MQRLFVRRKFVDDNYLYVQVLYSELEILQSRFRDHDTGHLKTAYSVISDRIDQIVADDPELEKKLYGL